MGVDRLQEQRTWANLNSKVKGEVIHTIENAKVYDSKGTDVTHLYDITIKTTEKRAESYKSISAMQDHERENGGFIFAFFTQAKQIEDRFPQLTAQDAARVLFIGSYVAWESNRLQYANGRIIRKSGLCELVGMSAKRFSQFFKKLISEQVLSESDKGELFMNPTLFYRGEIKTNRYDLGDMSHTRVFRKTIQDLYALFNGRQLSKLGVIYKVLPFLNFETNIICFNPSETDEDLLEPMNLDQLSTLLDYGDPHKLRRALEAIKIEGKPVFLVVQNPNNRRQLRVIVNPRVVFGGSAESLKAIKVLFN